MFIATLDFKRFDRDWLLLEHRRQPMRSWTKGLFEMLYLRCAQIGGAAPLAGYDNDGTPRNWAMGSYSGSVQRALDDHGRIAAPGGLSYFKTAGQWGTNSSELWKYMQGNEIGIQIGNDNTAVTTTDKKLGRRIGNGKQAADAVDATFEAYDTGDSAENVIYGSNWLGQLFIPQHDFRCWSVELKLWKQGNPPNPLDVYICAQRTDSGTDVFNPQVTNPLAAGQILAGVLGATPGTFTICTFGTPIDLYAGRQYAIISKTTGGDGSNRYWWRKNSTSPYYGRSLIYSGNYFTNTLTSNDSGATFNPTEGQIHLFKVVGRSIGEFEYSGCEVNNISFSDPNGSFNIQRFFRNRSGASIDVQEVGINALFNSMTSSGGGFGRVLPVLIARDVVDPAITVANNEILLVTYTPQITV